jgi:hypothetical protein
MSLFTMYHMHGVNSSVTLQGLKCHSLIVFHNFCIFCDFKVDWHGYKFCRSCHYALIDTSRLLSQYVNETTRKATRLDVYSFCINNIEFATKVPTSWSHEKVVRSFHLEPVRKKPQKVFVQLDLTWQRKSFHRL